MGTRNLLVKRFLVLFMPIISGAILLLPSSAGALVAMTDITDVTETLVQTSGGGSNFSISADGRYVVFRSTATNLVADDTNGQADIFRRDIRTGTTVRVSTTSSDGQLTSESWLTSISADGRYVAFTSCSSDLVPGYGNWCDVFRKDLQTGQIEVVSTDYSGTPTNNFTTMDNNDDGYGNMSADGRYIVFQSTATNLVTGDTNGSWDIFMKDMLTGLTTRVSTDSSGAQSNDFSGSPSISADGRYVAFNSDATNLVPGDTNETEDIFVKDLQTGVTTRVNTDTLGGEADLGNWTVGATISADGRYVAFETRATNLVPGDTNGQTDIFLKDLQTGVTTRVSTDSSGAQANSSSIGPSISGNGRYVVFTSTATNLVPEDTDATRDAFIKDLSTGEIALLSGETAASINEVKISTDGRYITYDKFYRANPFATIPEEDDYTSVPMQASSGGTTTSVLANDIRNGSPVDPLEYVLSIANDGGLLGVSINTDGTLSIPSGAGPGTYSVTYQMCEVAAPTYCETSTAMVAVLGASTTLAETGLKATLLVVTMAGSISALAVITNKDRRQRYLHPLANPK